MLCVLSFAVAGCFCSGCGLVFNGRKQLITIRSEPTGARIVIPSADMQFRTPVSVRLPRGKDYVVLAEKPGFKMARAHIASDPDPWPLALDFAIFFPSLFVDAPLGATYVLSPQTMRIVLEKKASPEESPPPQKARPPQQAPP